jgi:hypothetical protein
VTATAMFAVTAILGLVFLPTTFSNYWLSGYFLHPTGLGPQGGMRNQSMFGTFARLTGSLDAARPWWLIASLIVGVAGMTAAAVLHRAGQPVAGWVTCALTALLISPISWDHHWVWIVPGVVVAGHYAVTAWKAGKNRLAGAYAATIAVVLAIFACWPGSWLHTPKDAPYQFGLIWLPPQTTPFGPHGTYVNIDKPWFYEYHWRGLQLLTGNAYVLAGMAVLLAMLLIVLFLPASPTASRSTSPPA